MGHTRYLIHFDEELLCQQNKQSSRSKLEEFCIVIKGFSYIFGHIAVAEGVSYLKQGPPVCTAASFVKYVERVLQNKKQYV